MVEIADIVVGESCFGTAVTWHLAEQVSVSVVSTHESTMLSSQTSQPFKRLAIWGRRNFRIALL